MEYTNDVILDVEYDKGTKKMSKNWTTVFCRTIKKNKLVTVLIGLTIIFITVDCIMISQFIKILKTL